MSTRSLALLAAALVAFSSCGLRLTRGPGGWTLEEHDFAVMPIKDGRLMPDGWLLQNYEKVAKGNYQQKQRADIALTFSRSEDDGFLAIDELELPSGKTLRTLTERMMQELRTQQIEVSAGQYRAYVQIDEPVTELVSAPVAGEGIEAYEIVVAQRHQGERDPYRNVYLAVVRAKGAPNGVIVTYVNSPASFAKGIADARDLVRRVKLAGAMLPVGLDALDTGQSPKSGDPIRL